MNNSKVIVALDYDSKADALAFVDKINPNDCRLKVGKEMFTYFGPEFVKELVGRGFDVFLDLKFHDIPNTVAKAVKAAAELGVWMTNVHASGGSEMMQKAKEALEPYGENAPLLIAVTVLTSMDEDDLHNVGVKKTIQEQVLHLATLTKECALDGVVCSPWETELLKSKLGQGFKVINPGIRPEGSNANDQKRIMTAVQADAIGTDYMVIGRPITKAADPQAALEAINASIAA